MFDLTREVSLPCDTVDSVLLHLQTLFDAFGAE